MPPGMFMASPPSPQALNVERGSRMKPLHLAFSLAAVRPELLEKKGKKKFGTWPNRLGPGSEHNTPHKPP